MCARESGSSKSLKQNLLHKSPTVQKLREDIRKQFKEKIKLERANDQCKRRQLYNTIISDVQERYSNTNASLCDDGTEVLNTEEMLQILVEVEQELIHKSAEELAEQHRVNLENETKASLEQFVICSVCNKLTESEGISSNMICNDCAKLYFNNENF